MTRRICLILLLILGLLAVEVVVFLGFGGERASAESVRRLVMVMLASGATAAVAGAVGIKGMWSLRHQSDLLGASVRGMIQSNKLARVQSRSDLETLVYAIDDLVDFAERSVSGASIQAKELEIQLKVATAERQHAQAIIYSISDAVLVTDPFDELVLANESAARAFEFDLGKAMRNPIGNVVKDTRLISLIREMRQSKNNNERRILEHEVVTPTGSRTFKCTLSCVADRNDQPAGVVAVMHDMTREREIAQMKNDFVSNVSHELRTPLASIKAYVEMLIDGEADDQRTQREFYDVIQNEANRLSRLIDDILNISRIESGLIKVRKAPLSLTVVIKEAIEVISPQAMHKHIAIDDRLTPIFFQTLGDKDMLYQAVLNLLSNAVKYTPENGKVTVQTLVDETRKTVSVRISDTGVGIPPGDLAMVFDKFFRVESSSRMAKGTGLGLSLVKQIVETVHQGKMFVESQVGKGSCFGFELNLTE
jgi:two-component system phosphate regulon sensor histidine kinase PhoR